MAEETKTNATAGASEEEVKNQSGQTGKTEQEGKEDTKGNESKEGKGSEGETSDDEVITLTKAEQKKREQSEADKRVREAEKTFERKFEQQLREKIKQEREDAERLAKLSQSEREQELFERNKNMLEEKEKTLRQREMKLAAIDVLTDEELPVSFADQLLGETVDDTHDRIQKFKKAWHDAIDAEVNKRLKGRIPEDSGSKTSKMDMNAIIRQGFRK